MSISMFLWLICFSAVDGSTHGSPQHLEGKKQAKSAKSSKYDQSANVQIMAPSTLDIMN